MQIRVPVRDRLICKIPLFCRIEPLARPRVNYFTKRIHQPLDNQQALLTEVSTFDPSKISGPVYVDIAIILQTPTPKRGAPPPHPTSKAYGDLDNLAKAVNDALVKAQILADDSIIVGHAITKAFGPEDLATVAIWSVAPETKEVSAW